MYTPNFEYTDQLVNTLLKLEHNKTMITSSDFSYNIRSKLTQNAKTTDMLHLANMIGQQITFKDAESLALGKRLDNIPNETAILISNFRNALEFNRSSIADTYNEADNSVLLHLNKIIISSWRESWDARFRSFHEALDERFDDWQDLRDINIDVNQIEIQIGELIEWYKSNIANIAPIVRIAIFIYRLIEIMPYIAGNKITIIAVTDYMLYKNGLSTKAYISVVRHFDTDKYGILETFQMSRRSNSLTTWIESFAKKINEDLLESREETNKFIVADEKKKNQPFLDLNKRQLKVLKYLQAVPAIQREDYCHMMEVSTMTAYRDLDDLVRKKLLKIDGQGRGTKYVLASR